MVLQVCFSLKYCLAFLAFYLSHLLLHSMNKSDPDRARCSAPEEEYEATHTPESAADARTRKHLRVWVRRLQTNEAYEARQPTLTRGKKRAVASSSKDPYEWVRCCNPSCGKWRAVLRIMDAKSNVIDRTTDGEWYCRCVDKLWFVDGTESFFVSQFE